MRCKSFKSCPWIVTVGPLGDEGCNEWEEELMPASMVEETTVLIRISWELKYFASRNSLPLWLSLFMTFHFYTPLHVSTKILQFMCSIHLIETLLISFHPSFFSLWALFQKMKPGFSKFSVYSDAKFVFCSVPSRASSWLRGQCEHCWERD